MSKSSRNLIDSVELNLDTNQGSVSRDGIDRRGFLKCMAWAGTGLVWSFAGGVPVSRVFGQTHELKQSDFSFVQISDSHIGFNKPANADVTATLQAALDKIGAYSSVPEFLIHTGDLTHSSKPAEFDTLDQVLVGAKRQVFYVPGEHDTSVDDGKMYLDRYGKGTKGNGWYSFDHKGVHFIGLVNVVELEGMGKLGRAQLDLWLKQDLRRAEGQHSYCAFRAHSTLGCVPNVGMGNIGQRAGLRNVEAIWLGHSTQWPYPSGYAEGGRQCHVSHCNVHRISSTCARHCAVPWANEGASREASGCAGNYPRQFRGAEASTRHCRLVIVWRPDRAA